VLNRVKEQFFVQKMLAGEMLGNNKAMKGHTPAAFLHCRHPFLFAVVGAIISQPDFGLCH